MMAVEQKNLTRKYTTEKDEEGPHSLFSAAATAPAHLLDDLFSGVPKLQIILLLLFCGGWRLTYSRGKGEVESLARYFMPERDWKSSRKCRPL